MHFHGIAYRAVNPVYAAQPLSGRGAQRFGGRFNRKGRAALYLALSPETAIRESNQIGILQPTVLIAYEVDTLPIFNTDATGALSKFNIDPSTLGLSDWRDKMKLERSSPTQDFAENLIEDGYVGLLVPSYARGATSTEKNIVLWSWNKTDESRVTVVDDEERLRFFNESIRH